MVVSRWELPGRLNPNAEKKTNDLDMKTKKTYEMDHDMKFSFWSPLSNLNCFLFFEFVECLVKKRIPTGWDSWSMSDSESSGLRDSHDT